MHLAIFSKSVLDVKSIRENIRLTITKNSDANRLPIDAPLTLINAFSELKDTNGQYIRSFESLDCELDHIFVTVVALIQDGTYLQILANSRHIRQHKIKSQEGFTCCLISGSLNEWKSNLLDYLKSPSSILLREYATRVLKLFETAGISKTLLEKPISQKLDNLYYLESRN